MLVNQMHCVDSVVELELLVLPIRLSASSPCYPAVIQRQQDLCQGRAPGLERGDIRLDSAISALEVG